MRAAIAVVVLAFAVGCSQGDEPAAPRGGRRPNLLLVTIDTLRADHLSCYGYERRTSPNLDRLAAEGWRFTHAQTPRAKTTPAIASLLSGLYPHGHGVRDLSAPLTEPVPLLQEVLAGAGYRTAGLVGNFVLIDERAGLARGFEHWEEELPDVLGVPPHDAPQRLARSVTDGALAILDSDDDRPWFLWLHYMDPHGAYAPPPEHDVFSGAPDPLPHESELEPARLHRFRVADYNVPSDARTTDGRIDRAVVVARYDGEIRYADAELGRLLDHLRADGTLDDTLVVVTSDHGESLGEHRYWFEHGVYAYEATCRVPLIVRPPASLGAEAGVRAGDVSLTDLAPTLLDLLGVERAIGGRSLRAMFEGVEGATGETGPVFCEKVERADLDGAIQIKAVRHGDWKLIRRFAHRPSRTEPGARELVALSDELYDLGTDPSEERDLSGAPPPEAPVEQLRAALLEFTAADEHFAELALILQQRREALEREDTEALRVLRALGY